MGVDADALTIEVKKNESPTSVIATLDDRKGLIGIAAEVQMDDYPAVLRRKRAALAERSDRAGRRCTVCRGPCSRRGFSCRECAAAGLDLIERYIETHADDFLGDAV